MPAVPESDPPIRAAGPWTHLDVSANGIRHHVVTAGSGPLVLLLHGFPQFWWVWREQLVALADAGLQAAAVDLRGYGDTDKPPRGYDAFTLAGDVAGLVRALGAPDADVVGHDWGGTLAWTTAALHPRVVRRIAVLGSAHPVRMRQAMLTDPRGQLAASRYVLGFQTPRYAEASLLRNGAAQVEALLRSWSGPAWRRDPQFPDAAWRYRAAMAVPAAAHSALEYFRWMTRCQTRPEGWRYFRLMAAPISTPTLQLHGVLDSCVLPTSAMGSSRYVAADYQWRLLAGAGHLLPEEAPDRISGELIAWSKA